MIQIDMPMPERCGVCFAMHTDEIGLESWCGIDETARDLYTADINTNRPEWCPLKEQETQKFLVDETGKITPLPVVVRCKDCKHRGNSEKCVLSAISEEKDFPLFMLDNRGDWFCADGKRRDDND